MAIAFVSVLLHELGHAIAFRRFGIEPRISLYGFGGLTGGEGSLTPARHIVVSLAGPLAALCLLGLPALWLDLSGLIDQPDLQVIVAQAVWINIGWSLVNLVPILPLDGGQVLASLIDMVTGGRGQRATEVVSVVVAVAAGVVAVAFGFLFGALLAAMFVALNLSALSRSRYESHGQALADAQRLLLAHRPVEAEAAARAVLARRPSGLNGRWAHELLAWARLWQGDLDGAQAAVAAPATPRAGTAPGAPLPGPSGSFRAAMALAAGRTGEGVATMAWAFVHDPPGPAKSLGAVAAAGSGQAAAVARELVLLGPDGLAAARLLGQLLDHTGYHADAAAIGRLLATA